MLQRAIDDASESGYLTRHVTREHMRKHGVLEPVVDRITSLKPAAQALADDWNALYAADRELVKAVVNQASNGILSQRRDKESVWDD